MKTFAENNYANFIKKLIETEGIKVAFAANKIALETDMITQEQYDESVNLMASAFMEH